MSILIKNIAKNFQVKLILTVESSDPVANASPDGWNLTLLTSDSLPSNI